MSKHDETLISTIAEPVLNNIGRDMTYPNVVRAVNRQNRFQTLGRVDGFDQDEASAIFWSRSRRANGQAPGNHIPIKCDNNASSNSACMNKLHA